MFSFLVCSFALCLWRRSSARSQRTLRASFSVLNPRGGRWSREGASSFSLRPRSPCPAARDVGEGCLGGEPVRAYPAGGNQDAPARTLKNALLKHQLRKSSCAPGAARWPYTPRPELTSIPAGTGRPGPRPPAASSCARPPPRRCPPVCLRAAWAGFACSRTFREWLNGLAGPPPAPFAPCVWAGPLWAGLALPDAGERPVAHPRRRWGPPGRSRFAGVKNTLLCTSSWQSVVNVYVVLCWLYPWKGNRLLTRSACLVAVHTATWSNPTPLNTNS